MSQSVIITNGRYSIGRDSYREIKGVTFPLIDATLHGSDRGTYIVVDGVPVRGYPKRNFKVFVDRDGFVVVDGQQGFKTPDNAAVSGSASQVDDDDGEIHATEVVPLRGEDDNAIKDKFDRRFRIVRTLVNAAVNGKARGVIISGPPGVGKSHVVMDALENSYHAQVEVANILRSGEPPEGEDAPEMDEAVEPPTYRVVSGHLAPMSLYQLLYDYRAANCVLVLDDCDSVLKEEKSLNILKKALNNTGRRVIDWGSRAVEGAGLPTNFEFNGSVVCITNLNFDSPKFARTALGEHLKALISRVYYVDIGIRTVRELFLRIDQVCNDGNVLVDMGLTKDDSVEVMAFFEEHLPKFRELSIRTVEKIAMTRNIDPLGWQELTMTSTFRPEFI